MQRVLKFLKISPEKRLNILTAWIVMLLISDLPDVLFHKITGQVPEWLVWEKVGILAGFLLLCQIWKRLRPLRQFGFVFLVFYLALRGSSALSQMSWWNNLHNARESSFFFGYLEIFVRDLVIALLVIMALLIVKRKRSEFFLVKGKLNASVEPVRWLGMREGESWKTIGWIVTAIAGIGLLVPVLLIMKPSWKILAQAAPLLPSVLLFSGINAFTEEVYFRLSLLATLYKVIGKTHALLINAVFFGLAHYLYGSPSGIVGFLTIGFLGWWLGKSILETRGVLWAWFIHFIPDVIIFSSYAIDWVQR